MDRLGTGWVRSPYLWSVNIICKVCARSGARKGFKLYKNIFWMHLVPCMTHWISWYLSGCLVGVCPQPCTVGRAARTRLFPHQVQARVIFVRGGGIPRAKWVFLCILLVICRICQMLGGGGGATSNAPPPLIPPPCNGCIMFMVNRHPFLMTALVTTYSLHIKEVLPIFGKNGQDFKDMMYPFIHA